MYFWPYTTASVFLCFAAADGRGVQRRRLLGTGIPLAQEESLLRIRLRHFPRRRSFDVVYFWRTGSYSAKSSTCTVSLHSLRLKNSDLHELTRILLNQLQICWIQLQRNRFLSLIAHKVKFLLLNFIKHTMDLIWAILSLHSRRYIYNTYKNLLIKKILNHTK